MINRLRWHLHELDPGFEPRARSLKHLRNLDSLAAGLADREGLVARLARELVRRCRELTVESKQLEREIAALVELLAPSLLAIRGCGPLSAAKIIGETAASSASAPETPMPATTARPRSRSGPRTTRVID